MWKAKTAALCVDLLPSSARYWPDLDTFAGREPVCVEGDDSNLPTFYAWRDRRSELRSKWVSGNVYEGEPFQLYPKLRRAGKNYAVNLLAATADLDRVKRELAEACKIDAQVNFDKAPADLLNPRYVP